MFKDYIKENYKECCNRETFFKIRRDLENYDKEKFQKELVLLSYKNNPLAKIVLGTSREKYVDYGKYILTQDRYDGKHYLMIPKDLKYFNVLTLKKEDVVMLNEMKNLVFKHLSSDNILFFHCYPYNSIHTLHLHIVHKDFYMEKNNNILIDDVIYVLENE